MKTGIEIIQIDHDDKKIYLSETSMECLNAMALDGQRKIEAIKYIRTYDRKIGLKDSKEAIENFGAKCGALWAGCLEVRGAYAILPLEMSPVLSNRMPPEEASETGQFLYPEGIVAYGEATSVVVVPAGISFLALTNALDTISKRVRDPAKFRVHVGTVEISVKIS